MTTRAKNVQMMGIKASFTRKQNRAFTLFEILLVITLIVVLATVVIIAINPAKQLSDMRNTQRRSDVKTILEALSQYSIDHDGSIPPGIDTQLRMLGNASNGCMVNCLTGQPPNSASIVDATQAQFATGVYNRTQYLVASTWIELTAAGRTAHGGTYTSSIKDAGIDALWSTLSWSPEFPYQKELPNNRVSETAYNQGNANMTGNTLVMHMNDILSGSGQTISDTSGLGNDGTTAGSILCGTAGLFNGGCAFNGSDAYIHGDTLINDIAGKNFTILMWVKTNVTAGQQSFIAINTSTGNDKIILGHPAGSNLLQVYDTAWRSTGRAVTDNAWHQVGFILNDTGNQLQVVYDGAIVLTRAFASSVVSTDTLSIGMDYTGVNPTDFYNGGMDDVASWNRVFTAAEALNYWRRGTLRLKFQVRSCNDSVCSGETFIGPDGTAGTYYTELLNTSTSTPSVALINLPQNRYFQYAATFENDNTTYSPYLNDVTATHVPPLGGGNASFSQTSQNDFNAGTYFSNTLYDVANTSVRLNTMTTHSGEYRSPIKDAGVATTWSTLSWAPIMPYLKEFPNGGQSETGYASGNANMSGDVLLMHMNDSGAASGRPITDDSGIGNTGTTTGTVDCTVAGIFNKACSFNGTDAYINGNSLIDNIAGQNITLLGFVKIPSAPASTRTIVGINNSSGTNKLSLRISNAGTLQMVGATTLTSINVITSAVQPWHQIGFTINGTTATLYIDGVSRGNVTLSSGTIVNTDTFTIGASNGAQFFNGMLDELAVWNRLLTAATEIVPYYNRGTQALQFQVRSCSDAACSIGTFIGPDGTAGTYYTEIANTSLAIPVVSLTNVPSNRYFQYRTTFNNWTTSNAISPYVQRATTVYALPSIEGELSASPCLDISPYLVEKYVASIPISPSTGNAGRTFYAVKKTSTGRITVHACSAENGETIDVTR